STPNRLAITRTPGLAGFAFRVRGQLGAARGAFLHFWPAQAPHGLVLQSSPVRIRQTRPTSETSPSSVLTSLRSVVCGTRSSPAELCYHEPRTGVYGRRPKSK